MPLISLEALEAIPANERVKAILAPENCSDITESNIFSQAITENNSVVLDKVLNLIPANERLAFFSSCNMNNHPKNLAIFSVAILYPELLELIFNSLPNDADRLSLASIKDYFKATIFHNIKAEKLANILMLTIPEHLRLSVLNLVSDFGLRRTVFYWFISKINKLPLEEQAQLLTGLLTILPEKDLLSALQQHDYSLGFGSWHVFATIAQNNEKLVPKVLVILSEKDTATIMQTPYYQHMAGKSQGNESVLKHLRKNPEVHQEVLKLLPASAVKTEKRIIAALKLWDKVKTTALKWSDKIKTGVLNLAGKIKTMTINSNSVFAQLKRFVQFIKGLFNKKKKPDSNSNGGAVPNATVSPEAAPAPIPTAAPAAVAATRRTTDEIITDARALYGRIQQDHAQVKRDREELDRAQTEGRLPNFQHR